MAADALSFSCRTKVATLALGAKIVYSSVALIGRAADRLLVFSEFFGPKFRRWVLQLMELKLPREPKLVLMLPDFEATHEDPFEWTPE